MATNKVTSTENASRLATSSQAGFEDVSNLTASDWQTIGQVINGYAKSAKSDALNCNPSVLFIKTAKNIKERCNIARLPEHVANQLKELCGKIAANEIESLTLEGYIPHRISATKTRVDTRNLTVGTVRSLSLRRDNWTLESQLFQLNQEIATLEKAINKRKLDYKDTDMQELKLASWEKLKRVLKMEIAEKQAETKSE